MEALKWKWGRICELRVCKWSRHSCMSYDISCYAFLIILIVLLQAYLNPRWNSSCVKELKPYIKKSIYVSWMMCIHTPPMAIHTSYPGDAFDTRLYKQYTLNGPYVDYIVWPALLLYEHGPVICKGVAQGKEAWHVTRCSQIIRLVLGK